MDRRSARNTAIKRIVTAAPDTMAPEKSETVPRIAPPDVWAEAVAAATNVNRVETRGIRFGERRCILSGLSDFLHFTPFRGVKSVIEHTNSRRTLQAAQAPLFEQTTASRCLNNVDTRRNIDMYRSVFKTTSVATAGKLDAL